MTTIETQRPDHNSLGKGAFIIGLIGLVLAFVPVIGFVSWLLGPLAIVLGGIAAMRPKKSLAIAGIITGALALMVCFWWINMTSEVGKAMNSDTFNTTGEVADLSAAPIMDATVEGVWTDMEANKVAAGQKYGGHRLRFTDATIKDFSGDATNPAMLFVGKREEYLTQMVSASFSAADGAAIAALAKEQEVTFVCETIREGFGSGYSLSGCVLQP